MYVGGKVVHLRRKFGYLSKIVSSIVLILYLAGFSALVSASTEVSPGSCLTTTWPSELSDLAPDPSLVRGRLENGFRYVLKHHSVPQDRVAIFLDVQAGSLNETEKQRGVAHYLEHMMFNGSKNFPPGSLVDYFQSIGMNFGGDTNAHTMHDQTIYNIILPNGSEKDLDSGFLVMADYARGALLLKSEIDGERGVILAEKRARDSAAYRARVAKIDFALEGTRYPQRMPIGTKETLERADHDQLKSFYDAWYRPENMVLVVVGDISMKQTAALINKHFAKLKPSGPSPQCPDFGTLTRRGTESFYHFEPELGITNVTIETYWQRPQENDSQVLERKELLRIIGSLIMNYRLQKLKEETKVPFAHAGYYSGDIVNRLGYGSLSAQVDAVHWQQTVSSLVRVLRQVILYGFDKSEVERAKKEILARLDARVLTADSVDSRTIARRIIADVNNNRVFQSAEQEKELYGPLTKEIRATEVTEAFRQFWQHSSRLVSVTGDVRLGEDGKTDIGFIYRKSMRQPVTASISGKQSIFPYLQPPALPGSVPEQIVFPDIGVERLVFQNGLIVNLKKTSFEENRIRVRANFGSGKQQEPLPGMAILVEDIVNGSGSGKLPQSAVDALLDGSSLNMAFRVDDLAFAWTGSGLSKDFELYSQVLYTLLLDPGFRENVFLTVKENLELMYQKLGQEIEGAVPLEIQPFLAHDNDHFGLPAWDEVAGLKFETLEHWVHSTIKPEELEISVVGDFNRDEVVSVLAKYFGGIKLQSAQKKSLPAVYFPAGKKRVIQVRTSIDKSLIAIAWPTDDFWDIHRTRVLHLLAGIFGDRLRKTIREKLAASYAPSISSFGSRVYQGYGYLLSQMLVKPGSEEMVIKETLAIGDALRKEGITSNELIRARRPFLTTLKQSVRTNQYWLNTVLSLSSRYPQQLEWPKSIISDYTSISVKDINDLAARYLDNRNAAVAKVIPKTRNPD